MSNPIGIIRTTGSFVHLEWSMKLGNTEYVFESSLYEEQKGGENRSYRISPSEPYKEIDFPELPSRMKRVIKNNQEWLFSFVLGPRAVRSHGRP